MSATFKITPLGGSELAFGGLATKSGRLAISMTTGAPNRDLSVWHIPGTDGNVVCNMGYNGQNIIAVAIYSGDYATAIQYYENDKAAMAAVPCTIVDPAGFSHYRCRLKDSREQIPPRGWNDGTTYVYVYFIVTFTFEQHALGSE